MGSKSKVESAETAVSPKKKHSKVERSVDTAVRENSSPKKKKHSKNHEDPPESDFAPRLSKKKKLEAVTVVDEEAFHSKKKKKKKKSISEEDEIAVMSSKSKASKFEEVIKSPSKKRLKEKKDLEVLAESPRKKHKVTEEDCGKDSDCPSENIGQTVGEKKKSTILDLWPTQDMRTLFDRIRTAIPKDDKNTFQLRQEKIDWNAIAFGDYSGEECKTMWISVTKQLRGYRLLSEVVDDAVVWVETPWTKFNKKSNKQEHPDKPHRPLSSYMLYCAQNRNRIVNENPGIPITGVSVLLAKEYKSLSEQQRNKYKDLAAENQKEYFEKMEIFERNHPELAQSHKFAPKKSRTPKQIFTQERMQKTEKTGLSPVQAKEEAIEKWKTLSDKKRVKWIKKAVEEHNIYREQLKEYVISHPHYKPDSRKTAVLNRFELDLLLKDAGRPEEPPKSAYRLFMSEDYQRQAEAGTRPDDIFTSASTRWKNMGLREKAPYVNRCSQMKEEYARAYKAYLKTLSDEQRDYEELSKQTISKNREKKKKKNDYDESSAEEEVVKRDENEEFPGEPKKPPSSAYELFLETFFSEAKFKGEDGEAAWNLLEESDRKKFAARHRELMEKYMTKFERYLNSLNKEQLAAYKKFHLQNQSSSKDKKDNKRKKKFSEDKPVETDSSSKSGSDSESDSSDCEEEKKKSSAKADTSPKSKKKHSNDSSDDSSSEEEQEEKVTNNVVINKPPVSSSEESDSDSD